MLDVVERLRSYPDDPCAVMTRALVNEAADEIARLRAELAAERENKTPFANLRPIEGYQLADEIAKLRLSNAKLREALEKIKRVPSKRHTSGHLHDCAWCNGSAGIACAALAETGGRGDG